MTTLLQDLRYAIRQMRHAPGFSLSVILVLAFGIGANAESKSIQKQLVPLYTNQFAGLYSPAHAEAGDCRRGLDASSERVFTSPSYGVTLIGKKIRTQRSTKERHV